MTITKTKRVYCGVDIGGTKILAALVDGSGAVLARKKCTTLQKASAQRIYDQVRTHLQGFFKEQKLDLNQLKGICLGIPGIVRPNKTDILRTPNINLANFPLAQRLSRLFGVRVILGNDVNLGLLGERWLGAARDAKDIIGLFPGTGVGGAIIVDGKLLYGAQGIAGELGHVIIDQNSTRESAGLRGTIEALTSRRAVEREIREAVKAGKKTLITELQGKDLTLIKSRVIAQALAKKDPVTISVMNELCRTLGNACISMRHILNPELIVLGGGLMEACGSYILPRVRRRSHANPFLAGIDHCRIVLSELGDDAVILGAVALLKKDLKKKQTLKSKRYPLVTLQRGDKVHIDNMTIDKSFYIRADGVIKELDGSTDFKIFIQKNMIDEQIIRRFCKKKTDVLIVARKNRAIRVTRDGRDYMNQHAIECKLLSIREAIKAYTTLNKRKALFVSQKPAG